MEAILAELKPGRELHTNVEFYAGVVMELCGLPREMFTPTFAAAGSSAGAPTSWSRPRTEDHPPVGPLRRAAPAAAGAGVGCRDGLTVDGVSGRAGRCQ